MADLIKGAPDPNGPQVFVADKIQTIGLASVSNGIPSIYFSGLEIRKLAENVGHAIVAIWCNLIGLPIHLFDQSALFAIGKLLGTPIQVDRATANKTRLSFARICVEIDITKPPPEEIILDICGRETAQQVRWDKIPAYCRECKHVGHSSNVSYAVGKTERPPKRNYNNAAPQKANQDGNGPTEKQANLEAKQNDTNEWRRQRRNKGKGSPPKARQSGEESVWEGPDIVGNLQEDDGLGKGQLNTRPVQGEEAATKYSMGPSRIKSKDEESTGVPWEHGDTSRRMALSSRGGSRGGSRGRGRHPPSNHGRSEDEWTGNVMSTNKYYSLMANGEFDVEACGEMDEEEMDFQTFGAQPKDASQQVDADNHSMDDNHQIVIFQGGPSNLPGTTLPC
ncbi:uncharacterized protein LOC121745893 [Salvia splendens]|uniref:uncharacterized protein LOC121745893 n=1 Tax=Salvia splendens TaxID=180675 RepID=UPI001C273344|nr:uncharacterized protein LOC121745893 [Salvia splendens]